MAGGAGSRFSPLMASILECGQKIVSRGNSQKETMAICRIYVPEALSRSLFAVAFRLGAPHCSMSGFSNRPGSAVRLQGSRNQYIDFSLHRTFSRFFVAITCFARLTNAISANFSRRSKTQEHPRFAGIGYECNLKAVALKALSSRNPLCEKDSQGTVAGRSGEEYASPSGGAWPQPRSVGP